MGRDLGRAARHFLENAVEIADGIESASEGDLGDGQSLVFPQKAYRLFDFDAVEVLRKSHARYFLKNFEKYASLNPIKFAASVKV